MVDNQLVAFIGWDGFGLSNKKQALAKSKIHVGRRQGDRVYSDCRARRNYTHNSGFYEIFRGAVIPNRICMFCHEKYRSFWTKLQTGSPAINTHEEKQTLAEERAVLPHKTCDCIPELKDGDLVTFLGWHYFDYKTQTLKNGKIHVGKYRGSDESIRPMCQTHMSYHGPFSKSQHKIITAEKNIHRGCKFCRSTYPHLYKRLHEAKPQQEAIYQLTYPRKDKDGELEGGYHVITGSKKTMENVLKGRPEIHEHLNSTAGTRIKLIKGVIIEVEFKTRTIVDEVIIKE
jgi:hypothetical protein